MADFRMNGTTAAAPRSELDGGAPSTVYVGTDSLSDGIPWTMNGTLPENWAPLDGGAPSSTYSTMAIVQGGTP